MDEMMENLQRINMPRRIINTLTHVRQKTTFEFAVFYDIANMTVSSYEQLQHVKETENGNYDFPSSSKDMKSKLNKNDNDHNKKSMNNNEQHILNYEQIINKLRN